MLDIIEKLRDKLYKLILKDDPLYKGEILRVSQELDKQITSYLALKIKEGNLASGY